MFTRRDKGWQRFQEKVKRADGASVRIGLFRESGNVAEGLTMVDLGAIHEYGSPAANIPQRSFLRETFAKKQNEVKKKSAQAAAGFVKGRLSLARALDNLGQWAAAQVKASIAAGIMPENAPSTVKQKGSSKPLVNTGRLLNAITHKVVDAGKTGRAGYRK